jgi:AraC family transcriptional regulator
MVSKVYPRIETLPGKKLIGMRLPMSLAHNKTAELWRSFMPRRREILNPLTSDLISMQVYAPSYFDTFNPGNEFDKWAALEVAHFDHIPDQMEPFLLPGGVYAVFTYKGSSSDNRIFDYIFTTWLPTSGYLLDQRPHFEILGDRYKNADPASEEAIWIPIQVNKSGTR